LSSGVDQLADGANQLSAGLGQLNAQTGPLADGVTQLADGGNQLADGLGDAADGSVQLSSGLEDAAEAAPALPEGAQRLSAEGTSQLVGAGEDTTQSFGARVALIEAAAERTADGGLPYGGPQGAIVAAAYRYDLSAATGATAQNTGQLVAGLVVGGAAAAGATVLARRKTA
jgi:putative membrane protein